MSPSFGMPSSLLLSNSKSLSAMNLIDPLPSISSQNPNRIEYLPSLGPHL